MGVFIIIVIFLLVIVVISSKNKTQSPEEKDKERFLNMQMPDFEFDEPKKCLTYINEIPQRYVSNAKYNLDINGRIKNKVYLKAFDERDSLGFIDVDKFLEIFSSYEQGNFVIPENQSFGFEIFDVIKVAGVHLEHRKSYVVENLSEGDEVVLIAEPKNRYDKNAIQVVHKYFPFGYIPAIECFSVKPILSEDYKAIVSDIIYDSEGFIDVEITIYKKL